MEKHLTQGCIQVYTGTGKGKTTAAFGLALRALSHGLRVSVFQFLKTGPCSEAKALDNCFSNITLNYPNTQKKFLRQMTKAELCLVKEEADRALVQIQNIIADNSCDLLLLDEVCCLIKHKFISCKGFIALLKQKPQTMEVVLTGRGAPRPLLRCAHLVSVIHCYKHPFRCGIPARCGIEY